MKYDITHYEVDAGLSYPVRAAVLSDIHGEFCPCLLKAVKRERPDIILIPGDLTHSHISTQKGTYEFLCGCTDIAPTYMSIGNHENCSLNYVAKTAKKAKVILLDNDCRQHGELLIGGLTSGYMGEPSTQNHWRKTPAPDIPFLVDYSNAGGYKLLLSHHPEYYPEYIKDTPVNLTVSGHAHGGQWRIFGRPVFAPAQGFFPAYAQGFIDGRLIVSRGLSNNGPAPRFFNNREIVIIDLI